MRHLVQRSLRDCSAGVALTFAVAAIPIIGTIGIAVDLGYATQAKTQLNAASDAAALAAAKSAADAFSAGDGSEKAKVKGEAAGKEWFKSQASTVLGAGVQDPSVTVKQSGAVFSSYVTYQGSIKPYFAPLFGVSTIALSGLSNATITTTAYVSVTFLLDNSSSMLIAATQKDIDKMNEITPYANQKAKDAVPRGLGQKQCVYACHWKSDNTDYYGQTRDPSNVQTPLIKLRFDVLKEAASDAIKQMESQVKIKNQFGVMIYSFNKSLKLLFPTSGSGTISTDLESGATAARNIDIPVQENNGDTDFPSVMNKLAQTSTAAGDGSSVSSRKKALIIVTDGMADYYGPLRVMPTSLGPVSANECVAMKKLGYNIYVLYTTYVATPTAVMLPFDPGLAPYIPGIVPALQACASSPSNFAQASDPTAIKSAMTQMLQSALGNGGRYTQ